MSFDWADRLDRLQRAAGPLTPGTAEALAALRTALSAADRLAEAAVEEADCDAFDRLRLLAEDYQAVGC